MELGDVKKELDRLIEQGDIVNAVKLMAEALEVLIDVSDVADVPVEVGQ